MTAPTVEFRGPFNHGNALPGAGQRRGPAGVLRLLPSEATTRWSDHLRRLGPLPMPDLNSLLSMTEGVRLSGRGGGGYPTAQKIATVANNAASSRHRPVVIANCAEGDPTAAKDHTLMSRSPHLIIDGAIVAAHALNASRVIFAVHAGSSAAKQLAEALQERASEIISIVTLPPRFVASEASSLVNFLNNGDARPLGRLAPIWEKGVDGAPTLVDNAETLANLALLARFGPSWYSSVGTNTEPGTTLVTLGGAVSRPGVVETAYGTPMRAILAAAGATPTGYALVGGLAGTWVDLSYAGDVPYSAQGLAQLGASRGVGSIVVLPPGGCVLTETARITKYLADESAGQCGPCMFGLPAVATDIAELARGNHEALTRLRRRLPTIRRRGGCGHPDGAVTMAASAVALLTGADSAHLDRHLRTGRCDAPPPVVPLGRPRSYGSVAGS